MTDFTHKIPGKYRRAFSWRVSDGSPSSWRTGATAIVRLATSEFPDLLEDYLYVSRKRKRARPTRSRSPFINHQQSNLPRTANGHVCGICKPLGCYGPFSTQTKYTKRYQEPIATVAVARVEQLRP